MGVGGGTVRTSWWLVGACAIPALGKLLEDQQKLMLRRKPGAKTRCISHRLLLLHLPMLRVIQFRAQGTETGSGHGCPQFCADAVPWCLPSSPLGHYVVEGLHVAAW